MNFQDGTQGASAQIPFLRQGPFLDSASLMLHPAMMALNGLPPVVGPQASYSYELLQVGSTA